VQGLKRERFPPDALTQALRETCSAEYFKKTEDLQRCAITQNRGGIDFGKYKHKWG
jgi:hypothetical protein